MPEDVKLTGEAEKIWNEIKNIELNLFGLAGQTIEKFCIPTDIEPTSLYVTANVGSVFAALDEAIGKMFTIEMIGKFWVINRKTS